MVDNGFSSEDFLPPKIWPTLEKHKVSLGLALMGLLLLGGLTMGRFLNQPKPGPIRIETPNLRDQEADFREKILVDVSGAVAIPGVYQLPAGSRTDLALKVAGGLTEEADQDFVAKHLNLAAKLTDGAKVYIPGRGESAFQPKLSPGLISRKININTASSSELDTLPGVGPKTAEKIINGRPYENTEELLIRKIVGKSLFKKIKDKVSVY